MNVKFENGNAVMSIEDFMNNFNYDGKATGTYVAGATAAATATTVTGSRETYDIITDLITMKGLKPNLKGFKFTRKAIELCIQDPEYLEQITKRLYPDIAKEFKTTPSRTERAIRHAIEVAYGSNPKPTNSEFVAHLVEVVSAELRNQNLKVG